MKRTTSYLTMFSAGLLLLALANPVWADGAKRCSNATLSGTYAALLTGTSSGMPFAALDMAVADGNGNITGSGTVNVNGTVSTVTIAAMYTINADCSGTATFTSPSSSTQSFLIKNDGSQVFLIRTGPAGTGTVVSGTANRISKGD